MTRRHAFTIAVQGLGGLAGAAIVLPAVGFAVAPIFHRGKERWESVGPTGDFVTETYRQVVFTETEGIGDAGKTTAYVRKGSKQLGEDPKQIVAVSNRCVHLGCPVQAGGPVFDKESKTVKSGSGEVDLTPALPAAGFICPCHGGAYDQEGNRIAGPPVRALNRFEFAIVEDHLVLGDMYSVAKVDGSGASAKIHKYDLAGPGQHVDGPEQLLYPLQPPH
jgi:Rieske Fe-S protein